MARKLTIEFIIKEFDNRGYDLLEDSYVDAHKVMKYICRKHPHKMRTINWNNFNSRKGCKDCADEKNAEKIRIPFYIVENDFKNRNYTLLTNNYTNSKEYLPYICNLHIELGTQYVTYDNLKVTQHNCEICKFENIKRGEKHPLWKGGTEPLYDHLRRKLNKWKQDSMKECNFRCVITGDYFDVIHHLYSFNKIVEETLNILGLKFKSQIGIYSSIELMNIEKVCFDLHEKYGFGVCLSNEVHNLFHKIYGKYDNTPEQFNEFKEKYLNNEYNEVS